MGTKRIVAPRPRRAKGSGFPVAHPPTGLTLAKVTAVTRHVLRDERTRISGPEIAQLIAATTPKGEHHPPFVSAAAIWEELDCLAEVVEVLSVADYADAGAPLSKSLYWIGECLRGLGRRVAALDPSGNSGPNWYAVEVTK
jgi:hypothetical protein